MSPLVIAAAMLLGPTLATAEGVLLGVEAVPGPWTMVGSVVIVVGGFLIAAQAQRQKTTVDVEVGPGIGRSPRSPPRRTSR